MNVTIEATAGLFEEWDRRYRENPEQFMSEATHLLRHTPTTYGEAAAAYFFFLAEEMTADQVK